MEAIPAQLAKKTIKTSALRHQHALACAGGQMEHACPALSIAGTTPGTYTVTGTSTSTTTTGTVTLTVMASPALDAR